MKEKKYAGLRKVRKSKSSFGRNKENSITEIPDLTGIPANRKRLEEAIAEMNAGITLLHELVD